MSVEPQRGHDPLSEFLKTADYNERVTPLKFPDVYRVLLAAHKALARVEEVIEHVNDVNLLVPRFLLVRSRAAYLAAVRLAMAGEVYETYPVVRAAIENAWYALHIARDPAPPARVTIWLSRNDDAAAKARCKTEFQVAQVRATHEAVDATTATIVQTLYEQTIEFGGHPNEKGVLSTMTKTESAEKIVYGVAILFDEQTLILSALKTAVDAGLAILKIVGTMFPERVRITGLDRETEALVGDARVFAQYVRK